MPEILEVEHYRRQAESIVGRCIARVDAPDAWYLKHGLTSEALRAAVVGAHVRRVRRRGKLLLLDLVHRQGISEASGHDVVLGLRFGMTGRLLVDGHATIGELQYGSNRDLPEWERFGLAFDPDGSLAIADPRRLGGVELDPDEAALGPDALGLTRDQLAAALDRSTAPLKARLLDQSRVAGLGNLLTDEALWRARLDPARPAGSLTARETTRLHRAVRETLDVLGARGGSHTGDLQDGRVHGGCCPRCGAPLLRRRIGGRTTFSCPRHQPALDAA